MDPLRVSYTQLIRLLFCLLSYKSMLMIKTNVKLSFGIIKSLRLTHKTQNCKMAQY